MGAQRYCGESVADRRSPVSRSDDDDRRRWIILWRCVGYFMLLVAESAPLGSSGSAESAGPGDSLHTPPV